MRTNDQDKDKSVFERLSDRAIQFAGSSYAVSAALLVVISWGVAGPITGYSERWQLFINSFTTIVTFLMVFLIQRAQNKDVQALQLKLDELLKHTKNADKELIKIDEEASEKKLLETRDAFRSPGSDDEPERVKKKAS